MHHIQFMDREKHGQNVQTMSFGRSSIVVHTVGSQPKMEVVTTKHKWKKVYEETDDKKRI